MSAVVETSGGRGIPARIVVAGGDLLADALASALETYGFATINIAANASAAAYGIDWGPDLAIIDTRLLDPSAGSTLISSFHRADVEVCVIDSVDDDDRSKALQCAGSATFIDRCEPFDELFRTITVLLRRRLRSKTGYRPSWSIISKEYPKMNGLSVFATLTEREQSVLVELIEGHCAEDIAKASFVSISTVRSQIKAILQKLGVNSQLAAVAMARRAGWDLERSLSSYPEPASSRRRRVS